MFDLIRAPSWLRFATSLLGGLVAAVTTALLYLSWHPEYVAGAEWPIGVYVFACWAAALAASATYWWISSADGPPPIEVHRDHVYLPRGPTSRYRLRLELEEIGSVTIARPLLRRVLIVDVAPRLPVIIRPWSLKGVDAASELYSLLRRRMRALPDADGRLARLDRREVVAHSVWSGNPSVMFVILAVVSLVFVLQLASGSVTNPDQLVRDGATAWWMVDAGDWYRLVTGTVLHFGWLHFAINVLSFAMVGRMVEGALGSWRFAFVALASGIAMTIAISEWTPGFGVGLSGTISGLIGAIVVLNVARRDELAPPLKVVAQLAASVAAMALGLEFIMDWNSLPLHAAGFCGGLVATWVILPGLDLADERKPPPVWIRLATTILVLLFAVGLGRGLGAATSRGDFDVVRGALPVLDDQRFSDIQALRFAEHALWRSQSTMADVKSAADGISRRTFASERGLAYAIEAALRFRLGRIEQAAALMRRAHRASDLDEFASRMMEIELERHAVGRGPPELSIDRDVGVSGGLDSEKPKVSIDSIDLHPQGTEIYVLLLAPESAPSLIRIAAAPDTSSPVILSQIDADLLDVLERSTAFLMSVEPWTSPPQARPPGKVSWRWWPFDPLLDPLPRPFDMAPD